MGSYLTARRDGEGDGASENKKYVSKRDFKQGSLYLSCPDCYSLTSYKDPTDAAPCRVGAQGETDRCLKIHGESSKTDNDITALMATAILYMHEGWRGLWFLCDTFWLGCQN